MSSRLLPLPPGLLKTMVGICSSATENRCPWARGRKGLELAIPMNEEAGCLIPACMFVEASAS